MGSRGGRTLGAVVGSHQLVVGGVDLHVPTAAAHPQLLPHQAEGGRVVGMIKDQVAIPMQFDLFPHRQIIGRTGQGLQGCPFTSESVPGVFLWSCRGFVARPWSAPSASHPGWPG